MKNLVLTTIAILLVGVSVFFLAKPGVKLLTKNSKNEQSTKLELDHKLEKTQLTLKTPKNYFVQENVVINDETEAISKYSIQIQNYEFNKEPPQNPITITGTYSPQSNDMNNSIYEQAQYEFIINTIEEFEVDGNRAIAGIYTGDTKNYIVLFPYNNKLFKVVVTNATPENITVAKEIIKTLSFEQVSTKTPPIKKIE